MRSREPVPLGDQRSEQDSRAASGRSVYEQQYSALMDLLVADPSNTTLADIARDIKQLIQ